MPSPALQSGLLDQPLMLLADISQWVSEVILECSGPDNGMQRQHEKDQPPLHAACAQGNYYVVKWLLEKNVNPLERNDKGQLATALASASAFTENGKKCIAAIQDKIRSMEVRANETRGLIGQFGLFKENEPKEEIPSSLCLSP